MLDGRVGWADVSGALDGRDGYTCQSVARSRTLRLLLVRAWLSPDISRPNHAVMTEVAASALAVCFDVMVRGSRPHLVYEQPSDAPRRYS